MVLLWLAVAAFYGVVLLVGLGVLAAVTGSSVVLALRGSRPSARRRPQLLAGALLALAGATAVGTALVWFGRVGGDVLAAAFAAS